MTRLMARRVRLGSLYVLAVGLLCSSTRLAADDSDIQAAAQRISSLSSEPSDWAAFLAQDDVRRLVVSDIRAIGPLTGILRNSRARVSRAVGLYILGEIGDSWSEGLIKRELAESQDSLVRAAARTALVKINRRWRESNRTTLPTVETGSEDSVSPEVELAFAAPLALNQEEARSLAGAVLGLMSHVRSSHGPSPIPDLRAREILGARWPAGEHEIINRLPDSRWGNNDPTLLAVVASRPASELEVRKDLQAILFRYVESPSLAARLAAAYGLSRVSSEAALLAVRRISDSVEDIDGKALMRDLLAHPESVGIADLMYAINCAVKIDSDAVHARTSKASGDAAVAESLSVEPSTDRDVGPSTIGGAVTPAIPKPVARTSERPVSSPPRSPATGVPAHGEAESEGAALWAAGVGLALCLLTIFVLRSRT